MFLRNIRINNLRNLESVSLPRLGDVNILYGKNGSGKTSFLEAVNLLGLGRPFRRSRFMPLIRRQSDTFTVFGELEEREKMTTGLGVQRTRGGALMVHIDEKPAPSASALAERLPLQAIDARVFRLLDGLPQERRQFMDWGVFHVKHAFHQHWQQLRRCLKQRNVLLRGAPQDLEQLQLWSSGVVEAAAQVDRLRREWVENFTPVFYEVLGELWQWGGQWQLEYRRGWPEGESLADCLEKDLPGDRKRGYTRYGPQAADLHLGFEGQPAQNTLSRGQQKLAAAALRLAQGVQLFRLQQRRCVFLVDDLSAELDRASRQRLCGVLENTGNQVFLSCIERESLALDWPKTRTVQVFHVKQGEISAEANN